MAATLQKPFNHRPMYPKNKLTLAEVKKFIILFYLIGFVGIALPISREFFLKLTPLALLLSIYLLLLYHEHFKKRDLLLFLLVFIGGVLIEILGVNTGLIFGEYHYGKTLGFKIANTPIIIGVNWLFLTYTTTSLSFQLKVKPLFTIFLAPAFMLVYDLVLEITAPSMDMWHWQNETVPFLNYIAWYGISFVFVSLFILFRINTRNPVSTILLISQFIFFVLLSVTLS